MAPLESPILTATEEREKTAFVACHIFTICTLPLLVVSIKLLKLKRSQVLLNLFLALCLNSVMALLMGFSPKHPARALCLVSSAGSRAGTALISVAVMNTVLMAWGLVRHSSGKTIWKERFFRYMLLWLPWAVFLIILLMNIAYLLVYPQYLYVDVMTCYSKNTCATISHLAAGVALLATLFFNIWTVIVMIRSHRQARQKTDAEREMAWSLESSAFPTPIEACVEVRILGYSLTVLGGLVASVMLYAQPHSHIPAVYQSACGVCCFLIFGTQPDIWRSIRRLVHSGTSSCQTLSDARPGIPPASKERRTLTSAPLDLILRTRPSSVPEISPLPNQGCTTFPSPTWNELNVQSRPGPSTDGESKRGSKESSWSRQDQDGMVGLVPCLAYDQPGAEPKLMGFADALANLTEVLDEQRV